MKFSVGDLIAYRSRGKNYPKDYGIVTGASEEDRKYKVLWYDKDDNEWYHDTYSQRNADKAMASGGRGPLLTLVCRGQRTNKCKQPEWE